MDKMTEAEFIATFISEEVEALNEEGNDCTPEEKARTMAELTKITSASDVITYMEEEWGFESREIADYLLGWFVEEA